MNELNKLLLSLLLVAAGFFGASLFGPPELSEGVLGSLSNPSIDTSQGLRPLSAEVIAMRASQPDALSAPASLATTAAAPREFRPPAGGDVWRLAAEQATQDQFGTTHRAAKPDSAVLLAGSESSGSQPTPLSIPEWGVWSTAPTASALNEAPAQERVVSPQTPIAPDAWGTPLEFAGPMLSSPWNAPQATTETIAFPQNSVQVTPQPGPAPVERQQQRAPMGERSHVVTDGDTLPQIAERYLGDAARAQELFELNRDRLENPDLLPIGVMIRVPIEARAPARAEAPGRDAWGAPVGGSPFQPISMGVGDAPGDGLQRESRLAPVGLPADRPAVAPQSEFFSDWNW